MHVLLGHDDSEPVLGLKLLVGPRWREFHCLVASRCCVSSFSFFAFCMVRSTLYRGGVYGIREGRLKNGRPTSLGKDKCGLTLMNLDGAGPILHDFQCRISWSFWFGRLWGANSGSRTLFTTWDASHANSHRKFVS